MKRILFIFLTIVTTSCGKNHEKLVGQSGLISGKAYSKNRFDADSNTLKPLASQDIFIRRSTDPDENYLYKVTTDQDGNFYFNISTRPVVLFTRKQINVGQDVSALFYGKTEVTVSQAMGIQLVAEFDAPKQNAIVLSLKDDAGGSIPSTTVQLYNSVSLAAFNNPALAVGSFTTDIYGRGFKLNLPPGNYYANATKTTDSIIYQRLLKQVAIPATGVLQDTMLLRRSLNLAQNGFNITVKDSLQGNIPGATVYLYNSQVLAVSQDPGGAIDTFITDMNGRFSRINLPAGTYYLNATKVADTIYYQRLLKQIILPATGFITDTMIVRRTK